MAESLVATLPHCVSLGTPTPASWGRCPRPEFGAQLFLTQLDLRRAKIGCRGAVAVRFALIGKAILKTLDLRSNGIGPTGASAIADGVRHNATLQDQCMADNAVGASGAVALASGRREKTCLLFLDVCVNGIGAPGLSALFSVLRHGRLTHLNGQRIRQALQSSLSEALRERALAHVGTSRVSVSPQTNRPVAYQMLAQLLEAVPHCLDGATTRSGQLALRPLQVRLERCRARVAVCH